MSGHPVAIPEWSPLHRKLPKHSLCLTHIKVGRTTRCLAVPADEAIAYMAKLDAFAAEIAKVAARHKAQEAARPLPKGKGPKRVKVPPYFGTTKRHRHSAVCLTPQLTSPEARWDGSAASPMGDKYSGAWVKPDGEPMGGWYTCQHYTGSTTYTGGGIPLHEHRTKRGRKYLIAHIPGDASCPDVIAERKAAALAAQEVQS